MHVWHDWKAYVDYGDGGSSFRELAYGSSTTTDKAIAEAYRHIADDIAGTIRSAQHEIRRVVSEYTPPPSYPYDSLLQEALNTHQAPYPHHYGGIEYLRCAAEQVDCESVLENDPGDWWTGEKVREIESIDSDSPTETLRTVYLHDDWLYRVQVRLDDD